MCPRVRPGCPNNIPKTRAHPYASLCITLYSIQIAPASLLLLLYFTTTQPVYLLNIITPTTTTVSSGGT